MNNVTVPIPNNYESFIDSAVESGEFDSRSQFIRTAIKKFIEEQEVAEILEASRRAKMGEVFSGDLDKLAKKHA